MQYIHILRAASLCIICPDIEQLSPSEGRIQCLEMTEYLGDVTPG